MKTIVRHVEGLSFIGKGDSNHWVAMDADAKVGGGNAGSRPMELMLVALAGCTGMDVVSILNKMRVSYDDFYMELEADRAAEHPKVFTRIRLKYVLVGDNIPAEAVHRAVELSQSTYCSVSAMLRKACDISVEVEIRAKQKAQGR